LTYTIHRYPAHMIDVIGLGDGRRVTVRPVLPQDAELHKTFVRTLSAAARRSRFMTPLGELPDALAQRFSSIDYHSHLALLAEVFVGNDEVMVAEARYVVDERDPSACEFAIAVADDWHGSGLARPLLERLQRHARQSGIRRMVADTLAGNEQMIGLARSVGFSVAINREDARLLRLEKHLGSHPVDTLAA
jgi:acetyltransferase